jgi:polar amino acid transport system permease protein
LFSTQNLTDSVKFVSLAALLFWLAAVTGREMHYTWHWHRVPQFLLSSDGPGPLLEGLFVTLEITALALPLTILLGLATALFSLSHSLTARAIARCYLELIRNTPLLIQIFFIYFVLSPILNIGAFASAVLALTLFEGSYTAEILRSGIVSLPRGQWEAAHSLGLSRTDALAKVVLPQAVRRVLPPLSGQIVSLLKDSSLVSAIAIYDLTMQGQKIVAETFLVFEIWFTIAAIYLLLAFSFSMAVRVLERRINRNHFWWNGGRPTP